MSGNHEITQKLRAWSDGDVAALEDLMPLVYSELHRQARRYLRRERPNHSLETTGLIHETYLKLIDQKQVDWQNRAHFFAVSANMMRRILVDYARAMQRAKRGGNTIKLSIEDAGFVVADDPRIDFIALDQVLTRLAENDEQQARIVELRFFGGLSLEETACALGVSRTSVAENWAMAKAWLHRELTR